MRKNDQRFTRYLEWLSNACTYQYRERLNRVFPAAMPPDVRKRLCPSGKDAFLFWAMPLRIGIE